MLFIGQVLSALLALAPTFTAASRAKDAILLSTVKSLTLHDGRSTSHRRVSAIPQLACVGGNAKGLYNVDVMRCNNAGPEYGAEDISWTCQASLPPEFKLGSTDVICEGYKSPDDPYVLKGSCGVEYRLILTELGEEKFPDRINSWWKVPSGFTRKASDGRDRIAGVIFWTIFAAILLVIAYSICFPQRNNRGRHGANSPFGRGGGGGGGGGDNGHDPPPPYTPRAPKPTRPASTRYGNFWSSPSSSSQGWRPGFWTGAATGAAAGYAAGNWGSGRNREQTRNNYAAPGPSNWFGSNNNRGPGPSSYGASPSSSFGSGSQHQSTGFGGTRRR